MTKKCIVEECAKPRFRAGEACSMHEARMRRHGNYTTKLPPSKPRPFREYFDMYVESRTPGTCWEWTGHRDKQGYGRLQWKGRPAFSHRAVYQELMCVSLVPEQVLCHHCDNPPCVNPEHLFVGTRADNLRDMRKKGRGVKGESSWSAKLTEEQVLEARWRYQNTKVLSKQLAAEYGLTPTPMSQLLRGITWKHLPLVPEKTGTLNND